MIDAERKARLRSLMSIDRNGLMVDEQRELFDALEAAEARAVDAETKNDDLEVIIRSRESERGEWQRRAEDAEARAERAERDLRYLVPPKSLASWGRLTAERDAMREVLEDLEWPSVEDGIGACPECGALASDFTDPDRPIGLHAKGCSVGRALGRPECREGQ